MVSAANTRSLSIAKKITIKHVPFDAPWDWLGEGWRDLWSHPVISLGYGAAFSAISIGLLWAMTQLGWQSLVLVLAGGFLLVGPLFAVGLYEISRRRQSGEPITLAGVVSAGARAPGQLAFIGFVLLFLFGAWLRIAFLLFAIFFGSSDLPSAKSFIPELLFTAHGLTMLCVGTAVGAVLALAAYVISAVSVPMLLVHRVDAFTAIATSAAVVYENMRPMMLWAVLIAGIMAAGIATAFIGLVVAFPLVGHVTWHAFRATVAVGDT